MTTIILDKSGIDALFPEGSESRLKLQNTLLSELVKQSIKNPSFTSGIQKAITDAQKSLRAEVLKEVGISEMPSRFSSSFVFDGVTKSLFVDKVREELSEVVKSEASSSVISAIVEKHLDVKIATKVQLVLNRHLESMSSMTALLAAAKS